MAFIMYALLLRFAFLIHSNALYNNTDTYSIHGPMMELTHTESQHTHMYRCEIMKELTHKLRQDANLPKDGVTVHDF